jgi:ABC-type sugar transport system ATPase subunit
MRAMEMFGLKTKAGGHAPWHAGQPQGGPAATRYPAEDGRRAKDGGPVLECKDVKKTFGGVRALQGVSISLYPGEVAALVGDNGAGKSTLVKILGGTYAPDSGSIVIDDAVLTHLTPQQASQHGIEVVYQDLALCDNLTAGGNIVLGREPVRFTFLGLRFMDGKRAKQIGREQIARLGARVPNWDMPVRQLSGGQRQALAIARATISGHRLIVLDEPTAALGVKQTQATLELVRSIAAQDVAVMLIMHNLDQIFEVSERIIVLRHGAICLNKKVADTSKEEVVAHMTGLDVGTTGASE